MFCSRRPPNASEFRNSTILRLSQVRVMLNGWKEGYRIYRFQGIIGEQARLEEQNEKQKWEPTKSCSIRYYINFTSIRNLLANANKWISRVWPHRCPCQICVKCASSFALKRKLPSEIFANCMPTGSRCPWSIRRKKLALLEICGLCRSACEKMAENICFVN